MEAEVKALEARVQQLEAWRHEKDVEIAVSAANQRQDFKHMDTKFDNLEKQLTTRFDQADKRLKIAFAIGMAVLSPVLLSVIVPAIKFAVLGGLDD